MFTDELGIHPNEVFEWLETSPIASASLAQVHKGQLRNGSLVAVKVLGICLSFFRTASPIISMQTLISS